MNILFCNYEYPPLGGGGGVVNAWLAEALAENHNVTVLTSSAYGLAEEETVGGVRIVRVPVFFRSALQAANMPSMAAFVVNAMRKGAQLVRNNQFDIINTHFVLPTGPVGAYLSQKAAIPNVLSVHGGDLYDPSKFMSPHRYALLRYIATRLLRSADTVVGQSKNTIANVAQFYDAQVACERIPLGIPRTGKQSSARQSLGIDEDAIVLITIGRLVSRKGVEQLIELVHNSANPNLVLSVVGGGPKLPELKKQAQSLGIAHRIIFAGQASDADKQSLLASADVYVSTSQHEGFGLVFLEGMAAGLPIVCYDHGGQTDFIEDAVHGFVVKLNDKKRFFDCVGKLSNNKSLRNTLSDNCLRTVENYFIDRCAKQYLSLFERCIKHSQSRQKNS